MMRMKFGVVYLALVILAISAVLGACSSSTPSKGNDNPTSPGATDAGGSTGGNSDLKGKKLHVLLEDTPWHRNIETTISEFKAETGIDITLEFMPETQSREKVDLDLTTGTGLYDVFLTDQMYIQKFAKSGMLLALDDYVAGDAGFEKNDFPELALQTNTFDGKLYGIPWRNGFNVLMYRTDLLEKYEVDVPQTMEQLMDGAVKIREGLLQDGEDSVYGIVMRGMRGEGLNMWTIGETFLPAWGAEWLDADGKPQVNSPKFVEAIQFYADILSRAGSSDAASHSWDDGQRLFEQGRSAFLIDSAVLASSIYDAKGEYADKIGIALVPAGPAGSRHPGLYNPSYVVSSASKNKDAAWAFVSWATSHKQMLSDAKDGGNYEIARTSLFSADSFTERFPYEQLNAVAIESKKLAIEERPMIIGWPEVGDIVSEVAQQVIAGTVDAQTALDNAQKRLIELYDRNPDAFK